MASTAAKVLVVGPPSGQLKVFLSKTNAIHDKHGPFDALFVLGNLFSPSHSSSTQDEVELLLNGTLSCKIPTYFTLGTSPLPTAILAKIQQAEAAGASTPLQIVNNLFYLGSSGVTSIPAKSSPHPLNVAFIGGQWDPQAWSKAPLFNDPNPAPTADAEDGQQPVSHSITPRELHTLLAHPSLALSKPPPPRQKPPKRRKQELDDDDDDDGDQPMTLADARAQQAAKLAALTAASASTGPALPSVAAGLPVQDETEAPPRPQLDLLLLPYFPANILKPPPAGGGGGGVGGKRKTVDTSLAPIDPATLPHPTMVSWGAPPLATLTARARARYVFALGPGTSSPTEDVVPIPGLEEDDERRQVGTFFERAPFSHPASSSGGKVVTRFISLARLANPKKVRWFMALNLPLGPNQPPAPLPENLTPSPYGMLGFERTAKSDSENGRGNPNSTRLGTGAGSKHSKPGGTDDGSNPNFRFSTTKTRQGAGGPQQVPPRGYVCRLCSERGHYIQDCELSGVSARQKEGQGTNVGTASDAAKFGTVVPPPGYECKICLSPTHLVQRCPFNPSSAREGSAPRPNKRQKRAPAAIPVGPADCWFCLSNPACAKHLIVGIGSECYLSLPKGQLTPAPPAGGGGGGRPGVVPGGGHVLIIPINHTPSYLSSNLSDADRSKLLAERTDYLRALSTLYASHGAFALSWEIGRSEGSTGTRVGHTQTQVVPVPQGLRKGLEEVLLQKGKEAGYEFLSGEEAGEVVSGQRAADYFRLQIGVDDRAEGEEKAVSFVLVLRGPQARFNLQWPRQTLASILNTPERADWRVCARETQDEEREEAEAFKVAFQPYSAGIGGDDNDDDDDEEEEEEGAEEPDAEGY